jgi:hypothetical protein
MHLSSSFAKYSDNLYAPYISFGVFVVKQRGMEEAPGNGKELSHSARQWNGMYL